MYITFKSLINVSDFLIYLLHTIYSSLGICVHVGAGFLKLVQNQLRINHFPINFVVSVNIFTPICARPGLLGPHDTLPCVFILLTMWLDSFYVLR